MFKRVVQSAFNRFGYSVVRTSTFKRISAGIHRVNGHDMIGPPNDAAISVAGFAEVTPGPEVDFIREHVRSGMTVVDVGANIGLFTLLFASLAGASGRVYAFEPGPLSFGLLKTNLALNGYRSVTVENAAVSDFSGETELHICPTGESDNRITGFETYESERLPIKCFALDDYFKPGTRVDFVKMDIQGAEVKTLNGMRRVIADNPSIVLLVEANAGVAEKARELDLSIRRIGDADFLLRR